MNTSEWLTYGTKILLAGESPTARLDCEVMLAHLLQVERSYFLTHGDEELTQEMENTFLEWIRRRERHEPVAYIIGEKEFMGLNFSVDPHTLIPRPDTEVLVEEALRRFQNHTGTLELLDIGTGSGAIGLSLAVFLRSAQITAVDISEKALEVAAFNARKLGVEHRVTFHQKDCLEGLPDQRFHGIVSNPPYITGEEMEQLPDSVARFEPHSALYGGEDGLKFYRRITELAFEALLDEGWLLFEIGAEQGRQVEDLLKEGGFRHVEIVKDLSGLDRVVLGQKTRCAL